MDEMPHEAPPPPPPPRHHSQLERSYAQLGLPRSASSEAVRAAFRRMARELHPDVSTLPKEEAEHRFRQLNEAYTFIRVTMGW
jgi:curved DNA-binding protein CbpA